MCGRLTLTHGDYEGIATALEAAVDPAVLRGHHPRYNAAPRDELGVLRLRDGARHIVPARWGFDLGDTNVINARSEGLLQRPTFRGLVSGDGRCAVPSDGFFEWSGPKGDRQPWWFHRGSGPALTDRLLPFAGLLREQGDTVQFVIITVPAAAPVAVHHHRMPAMLRLDAVHAWLAGPGPAIQGGGDDIEAWLTARVPDDLVARPVSRRVNRAGVDEPSLLDQVELPPPAPVQTSLFGDLD